MHKQSWQRWCTKSQSEQGGRDGDHCGKISTLPGGVEVGGGEEPEVATWLGVPGAMHLAPHSGESQIAVVLVTLRDSVLVVGVSGRSRLRSLVYSISGLVVEYIVAIDVTRVRFPADAQAPVATLVHKVNEVKRVAEGVITVVNTLTLWSRGGGRGRGTGSLHTL